MEKRQNQKDGIQSLDQKFQLHFWVIFQKRALPLTILKIYIDELWNIVQKNPWSNQNVQVVFK